MPDAKPILSGTALSYVEGGRRILEGVDIAVTSGEIVSVIGPNGAGKTTLLKILLGQIKSTEGTVDRRPNLRIGYVPQHLVIDPTLPMTVRRFLMLSGVSDNQTLDRVMQATDILRRVDFPVQSLSGGEMQRLLLARALVRKPELLVLDEPAQGVDLTGQADIYQLIADIRGRDGCAVLLVSHDLHMVMAAADKVLCLNHHLCCSGHPEMISQHPEYLSLFGSHVAAGLAPYTHHHDHRHDVTGGVAENGHHHA